MNETHMVWAELLDWLRRSQRFIIKKLSRNDCSWADDSGKHQAGVYVPRELQNAGFFPQVSNTNPAKPHILDARFSTWWPASSESIHSALKHYTNKGTEFHFTRLPRNEFSELTPASLLIGGKLHEPHQGSEYWFSVMDSASDEAEILESALDLPANFHFGIFEPSHLLDQLDDDELLIAQITEALHNGTLGRFIAAQHLPSPQRLAEDAQQAWLLESGHPSLDPFSIPEPGDAVMRISRDIEFRLFKRAELRLRAAQAAGVLLQGEPVRALVHGFPALDALFLSATQVRKSRAGLSFEHHVQRLLVDGHIAHQSQCVFGGRRPDFVLPDGGALRDPSGTDALILSLKTTLRERWKQLGHERRFGEVFLATVDDRVSVEAINGLKSAGITLVVPESLKDAKESCYEKRDGVITFRNFFDEEIRVRRPSLLLAA